MAFWLFMFIVTLLIPFSLLLTGYLCPKYKTINHSRGYRTLRAMQTQETWEFAQKYCAKMSLLMFCPTLLLSIILMPLTIDQPTSKIGWTGLVISLIQMVSFVVIIALTEKALKKKFR